MTLACSVQFMLCFASSVIGAFLLLAMYEGSRFLNAVLPFINAVQIAYVRMAVIGMLLILFARYRPAGVLPEAGR